MADSDVIATERTGPVRVGTVEVLRTRVYPIDPYASEPVLTTVVVEPGTYPVYREGDTTYWMLTGRLNNRLEQFGDGLFAVHDGDVPTGAEVVFPSKRYGPDGFAELLADPVCAAGPGQRLVFTMDGDL